MGVRFACHACGKRLNIKSELAGRRGICPACSVRFRIPAHDTQTSTPIDASEGPGTDGSSASDSQRPRSANGPATANPATAGESPSSGEERSSAAQSRSAQPGAQSRRPNLDEILGGVSTTWYVRPSSGGQFGPADGPTLGQWITEGRVADSAMLWRDGWPEWRSAQVVLQQQGTERSLAGQSAARDTPSPPRTPPTPVAPNPALASLSESTAAPVTAVNAVTADAPLRTGGKVLGTNRKRVSRKRITMSVVLTLVLLMLLAALIFVLLRA